MPIGWRLSYQEKKVCTDRLLAKFGKIIQLVSQCNHHRLIFCKKNHGGRKSFPLFFTFSYIQIFNFMDFLKSVDKMLDYDIEKPAG